MTFLWKFDNIYRFWKLHTLIAGTPRFMKLSDRWIQMHLETYVLSDHSKTSQLPCTKEQTQGLNRLPHSAVQLDFYFPS